MPTGGKAVADILPARKREHGMSNRNLVVLALCLGGLLSACSVPIDGPSLGYFYRGVGEHGYHFYNERGPE